MIFGRHTWIWLVTAWVAVAPATSATLEIVKPDANEILYGPTRVLALFDGEVAPRKVLFYLDVYPRAICTVSTPPYVCQFDAGTDFQGRRIRAAAVDETGETIAESVIQTVSFPAPERVVVRTLEVPVIASGTTSVTPDLNVGNLDCLFAYKPCHVVNVTNIIEAATVPVSLEILVDVSGSVDIHRGELIESIEMVIDTAPVGVDVATTEFGSAYSRVGEFTQDKGALRRAVETLSASQHATCLVSAVRRTLRTLKRLPGHKLLFIMSDGQENCDVNSRRDGMAWIQAMWDLVRLAREAAVPIYIYRFEGMSVVGNLHVGRPRSPFAMAYEGVARETGGRLFAHGSTATVTSALSALVQDLRNTWIVDIDLPDLEHTAWERRLALETNQPEVSLTYPEYWRAEHREKELIGMLLSPDPGTRGWAAEKVGAGHGREVIEILMRAIKKEEDGDVLDAELSALQRVSGTLLVHGALADQKVAVRAIKTLRAEDPRWLAPLVPAMRVFPEVAATDKLLRRVDELTPSN